MAHTITTRDAGPSGGVPGRSADRPPPCNILSMANQPALLSSRARVSLRSAAAAAGLAVALTAGVGVASAGPDLGPAVNTTCSYPQVVSAMNAESPDAAAKFNGSPMAQSWLQRFLASPPPQRQRMAEQAENMPGADEYVGVMSQIVTTCDNY